MAETGGRLRPAVVAALMVLAACASKQPLPAPAPPPSAYSFAQCQTALTSAGAAYTVLAPQHNGSGCGFEEALRLGADPLPFSRPAVLACPLALAFARFTHEVLQPAAEHHFGQKVVKVQQLASYSCRPVEGHDRLSQHAYADAIDIGGFDLADGRRIEVGRDWRNHGAASAFLKDVANGACTIFRATLTPNYNRAHANHLHFDLGPDKLCGV
jgi:hypothetical protein